MKKTFSNIREHAQYLVKKCWIPLNELKIPKNILDALLYAAINNNSFKEEISLLGELAIYSKEEILSIKGIGPKGVDDLEVILLENDLYWDTPMSAIRDLAGDR